MPFGTHFAANFRPFALPAQNDEHGPHVGPEVLLIALQRDEVREAAGQAELVEAHNLRLRRPRREIVVGLEKVLRIQPEPVFGGAPGHRGALLLVS